MAPTREGIRRVLAKPLGIDIDHPDEYKHHEYAVSDTLVEPFCESKPTTSEFLSKAHPTKAGFLRYIRSLFPFTSWIFHYNLQWLLGDVVAGMSTPMTEDLQGCHLISYSGLTVGFVAIPQGMAYASLARLTPEYGLYTSFVGFLLYWAFATSKDITIGVSPVPCFALAQLMILLRRLPL